MKPIIIVVSAPSGAGKTTLVQTILERIPDLTRSVSFTDRPMRKGETNGKHYHFVTNKQFMRMVSNHEFIEWAVVHDNLYGTPRSSVDQLLEQGKSVLLVIDVQGAMGVASLYGDRCVLIFIEAPSFEELERRIRNRGLDTEEKVALRLKNARLETDHAGEFDHVIVNDDRERATDALEKIIRFALQD